MSRSFLRLRDVTSSGISLDIHRPAPPDVTMRTPRHPTLNQFSPPQNIGMALELLQVISRCFQHPFVVTMESSELGLCMTEPSSLVTRITVLAMAYRVDTPTSTPLKDEE